MLVWCSHSVHVEVCVGGDSGGGCVVVERIDRVFDGVGVGD